jgi:hypothetical protein
MNRTWTETGKKEGFDRTRVEAAIRLMNWREIPKGGSVEVPMMPGDGIKAAIQQLRIPKVSHIAWSSELAPYGFYAIRGHYSNGSAEIYIADMGTHLTPLCSDFHPKVSNVKEAA